MASVCKRQEKQAREIMKLREKDSKKRYKEREYYRKLQEDGGAFLAGVHSYYINKYASENKIIMRRDIIDAIIKHATEKALMDVSNNRPN